MSDQRGAERLLGGLGPIYPGIRTIMAEAGHQSRELALQLMQQDGWKLVIVKRGQRAFKITGLTWIVERSFVWLGRNRRMSKDYEYQGSDFRNYDRPRDHTPHAESPRGHIILLKHPLTMTAPLELFAFVVI
jgi:hypothetical protein